MKKNLMLTVILAICLLCVLTACAFDMSFAEATVASITIDGIVKVDGYIAGDEIDISTAKIIATYTDNTVDSVPLTADMLSNYDMTVPEERKKITVTYKGVSTYFYITVLDLNFESVALASVPNKIVYVEGENIEANGATININYNGGKTVNVAVTDKMLESYDNTKIGQQTIYISYFGYSLTFDVTFTPKTVKAINVLREPYQNTVFQHYGSDLSIDGMKLKLIYDNGLTPEVFATDISDSVQVYIDDSDVKTVIARVVYLPPEYAKSVEYEFAGNAMVSTGDVVYPDLALASNLLLDDVLSKTYGKVKTIDDGKIIIDTVVEYLVSDPAVKVGQIVLNSELLGKYGTNTVFTDGGGLVTSVANGRVTIQTAPTSSFNINVKDRSFQSMEILSYPQTVIRKTDTRTEDIIQGDTIDLATGKVRVYFDNGEYVDHTFDSTHIKVVNSNDDMLRMEIPDLEFSSVDDVDGLSDGRYELLYAVNYPQGTGSVSVVVSVIDENGKDIYVQENRYVSLELAKNYTVSIRATKFSDGNLLVSECNYHLATIGAGVRQSRLDIAAAGRHSLRIIYSGVESNSITFTVNVKQKTPVSILLEDATNNISNRTFYKGETIAITTLRYKIVYDNGDESVWSGVVSDMLGADCSLVCDEITNSKIIYFTVIGSPEVKSANLVCKVVPMPITSVSFVSKPDNVFLSATAGGGNDINLAGAVLKVYYKNGAVKLVGNVDGGDTIADLFRKESGERVTLSYTTILDSLTGNQVIPSERFTPEQIYNNNGEAEEYEAVLRYYDNDGAYGDIPFGYYLYYIAGSTKSVDKVTVDYREGQYKKDYIQCEDWDLTNIKLVVTYSDASTSVVYPTSDMIYKSTTDNIGDDIPLQFSYLGKITSKDTIKINVTTRMEMSLSVKMTGKDAYLTSDRKIDLSDFRFIIAYNAGAPEEILGITKFDGGLKTEGWWYQLLDTNGNVTVLNREGTKIIRLVHTTCIEDVYKYIECNIEIQVTPNTNPVLSISYIPDVDDYFYNRTHLGLPILAEVAAGWDIMFSDYSEGVVFKKMLTVNFENDIVGYADFENSMLNYNKYDKTTGYRKVIISYRGASCEVYVHVREASLYDIAVEIMPLENYIANSSLDLSNGVLRLIFIEKLPNDAVSYMYKYIDMSDEAVANVGFDSNIPENINSLERTITLTYKEKSISFDVTVYNKQDVIFKYQNTIFFYGRSKDASVQAFRAVPEFVLPDAADITNSYVSSYYFLEEGQINAYLNANPNRTLSNIIQIIVGFDNDNLPQYKYVDERYVSATHPYSPAQSGFDYYIMMKVVGNTYYKDANYCIQKYTIIPKVVMITSIAASQHAYIYRIKTNNMPATVQYLYTVSFDEIRNHFSDYSYITGLEMVSPNSSYLEIMLSVNDTFVENVTNFAQITEVFNYIKNLIQTKVVYDSTLPVEQQSYVTVSVYDLSDSDGITKGVNIAEYEHGKPTYITYRLEKGETLTLGGIMDLFGGSLDINVGEGGYRTGTFKIIIGTLYHNNYNVDFVSNNFIVTKRKIDISAVSFTEGIDSGSWGVNKVVTLNTVPTNDFGIIIHYLNGVNGVSTKVVKLTDANILIDGDVGVAVPNTNGEYVITLPDYYANADGSVATIEFTLKINI